MNGVFESHGGSSRLKRVAELGVVDKNVVVGVGMLFLCSRWEIAQ